MKRALALAIALVAGACDIQEITLAESEDIVIAEITLRAGDSVQTALLHRTLQNGMPGPAPAAEIRIRNRSGTELTFAPGALDRCALDPAITGRCYVSAGNYPIIAGETYTLRIELADGGVMTGTTTVPQPFQLLRPTAATCNLAPNTTFEIAWTQSPNAWVYVSETLLFGLSAALAAQGITLEDDPLRLFGLSLSDRDTTVVFPTGFGLFQRFDSELTKALVAIQNGLPPGIAAQVLVAAADRNYVNWERGGNFNPSGLVRVASIRGDGTGVFGSIVPHFFNVTVDPARPPTC